MRISDWSSYVCSSDLPGRQIVAEAVGLGLHHVEAFDVGPFLRRVAAAAGEGYFDVESRVLRRLLDRRRPSQNDRIGHRQTAAQLVDPGENLPEFGRIIDRPVLLRRQTDAGPIGAAAEVGRPEARRGGEGGGSTVK